MKSLKNSLFLALFVLLTTACGKKSFTAAPMTAAQTDSSITDTTQDPPPVSDTFEIHEISSGGGVVVAEDNSFQAEVLIGAVVFQEQSTLDERSIKTGFWNILTQVL